MNTKPAIYSISRVLLALTVLAGMLHQSTLPAVAATQFDILGPAGSVRFGTSVTVLPNGNIVVTDPDYNGGIGVKAGAVYLYSGRDRGTDQRAYREPSPTTRRVPSPGWSR